MKISIRRASPASLPLALAILLGGVSLPSVASAQTAEERLTALENALAAKKGEIADLEGQVQALRRDLGLQAAADGPPPPPLESSPGAPASEAKLVLRDVPYCRMSSLDDINDAFKDPRVDCLPEGGPSASTGAAFAAARVAQPLPDRPNPLPGLSSTLLFASGAKASVTYSHPTWFRKPFVNEQGLLTGQRPQILTYNVGVNVPIVKGESKLLSESEDLDLLTGTTVKFGIDFSSFRKTNRSTTILRMVNFLFDAHKACAKELKETQLDEAVFYSNYGFVKSKDGRWYLPKDASPPKPLWAGKCTGSPLMNWVMATERDTKYTSGLKWSQEKFASAYRALYWTDTENAIPDWGWGASVEIGTTDFAYRQGSLAVIADPDDATRVKLAFDRTVPLAAETNLTKEEWKLQGYLSGFLRTRDDYFRLPRGVYTDGIMGLISATYTSAYEFRPGTSEISICPIPAAGELSGQCATRNIDRPLLRDGITLAGEARIQFNQVPLTKVLGFAPRYSYRLEDNRQTFDFPVYLMANEKGVGTAGVRFTHGWNGEDLLGNRMKPQSDLSVFLTTPLNLAGF